LDLDQILDMNHEQLMELSPWRDYILYITVRGRMKGCGSKVNFGFSYTVSVYSVTY
jgi:hypothetical protein